MIRQRPGRREQEDHGHREEQAVDGNQGSSLLGRDQLIQGVGLHRIENGIEKSGGAKRPNRYPHIFESVTDQRAGNENSGQGHHLFSQTPVYFLTQCRPGTGSQAHCQQDQADLYFIISVFVVILLAVEKQQRLGGKNHGIIQNILQDARIPPQDAKACTEMGGHKLPDGCPLFPLTVTGRFRQKQYRKQGQYGDYHTGSVTPEIRVFCKDASGHSGNPLRHFYYNIEPSIDPHIMLFLPDVFHTVIDKRLLRTGIKVVSQCLYNKAKCKQAEALGKQHDHAGNPYADPAKKHALLPAQQICQGAGRDFKHYAGGMINTLQQSDLSQAQSAICQIQHPYGTLHIQICDESTDIVKRYVSL